MRSSEGAARTTNFVVRGFSFAERKSESCLSDVKPAD